MVDNTYYTLNEGLMQRTAATHFWLTAVTFTEDKPALPEPLRYRRAVSVWRGLCPNNQKPTGDGPAGSCQSCKKGVEV